jgi:8-oxo-dGTP diphosphatase
MEPVITDGRPGRDPRGQVVSVVHSIVLRDPPHETADTRWVSVDELPPLGFEHARLLEAALLDLRSRALSSPLAFALLPDAFALSDLQALLEAILAEPLDRRNFRRKLKDAGFLAPVRGQRRVGRHRPAQLYRFKPDAFTKWAGRFRGRDFLR